MKDIGLQVNTYVNKLGMIQRGLYVVMILSKDNTNYIETCENNVIEQRRDKFKKSNLSLWFDTWEDILVNIGFGQRKGIMKMTMAQLFF